VRDAVGLTSFAEDGDQPIAIVPDLQDDPAEKKAPAKDRATEPAPAG
jgi:hypothetical protein